MSRYRVVSGSESGHCCFVASIVDTKYPVIIHGKHYIKGDGEPAFEAVCECFNMQDAINIVHALNEKNLQVN